MLRRLVCLLLTVPPLCAADAPMRTPPQSPDAVAVRDFGVPLPSRYRDWRLITVAHEEGSLNDLRAILGNDVAIRAYRAGKRPFPDGTIIARLAWRYVPSPEDNTAFGRPQSFVAGAPANGVQFMVKDSKKYASTGGWGFAQFNDGKLVDRPLLTTCYTCHRQIAPRDLVFSHYAP